MFYIVYGSIWPITSRAPMMSYGLMTDGEPNASQWTSRLTTATQGYQWAFGSSMLVPFPKARCAFWAFFHLDLFSPFLDSAYLPLPGTSLHLLPGFLFPPAWQRRIKRNQSETRLSSYPCPPSISCVFSGKLFNFSVIPHSITFLKISLWALLRLGFSVVITFPYAEWGSGGTRLKWQSCPRSQSHSPLSLFLEIIIVLWLRAQT